MRLSTTATDMQRVPVFSYGGWLTVGATQKGDVVKDLMQKAFDLGINMFDVSCSLCNTTTSRYAGVSGSRFCGVQAPDCVL